MLLLLSSFGVNVGILFEHGLLENFIVPWSLALKFFSWRSMVFSTFTFSPSLLSLISFGFGLTIYAFRRMHKAHWFRRWPHWTTKTWMDVHQIQIWDVETADCCKDTHNQLVSMLPMISAYQEIAPSRVGHLFSLFAHHSDLELRQNYLLMMFTVCVLHFYQCMTEGSYLFLRITTQMIYFHVRVDDQFHDQLDDRDERLMRRKRRVERTGIIPVVTVMLCVCC